MKFYSFSEFMQIKNYNSTQIDKILLNIKKNEKMYKQLIFLIAILTLPTYTISYAIDFSKIDALGLKGLKIVRAIGYWAIIIKGGSDIVGYASQGDAKGAIKCAFQYVTIFAILFLFPMMLDLVKEAFN